MSSNDEFKPQGEEPSVGVAAGDVNDPDYKSRTGQYQIPVHTDDKPVENPIDGRTADSDEQLEADDKNAIDQDNVISSRTRGAAKSSGTYQDPGDEEGMPPASDGTSRMRTG